MNPSRVTTTPLRQQRRQTKVWRLLCVGGARKACFSDATHPQKAARGSAPALCSPQSPLASVVRQPPAGGKDVDGLKTQRGRRRPAKSYTFRSAPPAFSTPTHTAALEELIPLFVFLVIKHPRVVRFSNNLLYSFNNTFFVWI